MASLSNPLPETVRHALAHGALVLTPNEAAAAGLRARFDLELLAEGRSVWQPAAVMTWNTWMRRQWDTLLTEGVEQRTLLNDAQEQLLWREVIAHSSEAGPLLSRESLAALAAQAWRLACSYEAEGALRRAAVSHDAKVFAGWAEAFAKDCRQRQCVSSAAVEGALRKHVESSSAGVPVRLCLVGFEDDTPSRARLLATMAARGTVVEHVELQAEPNEQFLVACDSLRAEAAAAARWIRFFLEREGTQRRVALIVPGLGEERAELEPVLRDVLAPELQQIGADLAAAPFAFSTGRTLADSALAAAALDALRWCVSELPLEDVTRLLLSPYLGTDDMLAARAAFDAHTLRRAMLPRPELSASRVEKLAEDCAAVRALCAPIARHGVAFASGSAAYSEWMERFAKVLSEAGFPGNGQASSQEADDLRAWQRACDVVASLDFAGQRVSAGAAIEALAHQCRETASRGSELAPVQVITPSEAAGGWFDAVVFLRATDAKWPASEKTNPLLGWGLQQAHRMPGTDPALAAERGQRATERLVGAAPSVLFFYATNADDESGPQRLAPVVERLAWTQVSAEELTGKIGEPAPVPLERVVDDAPLPAVSSGVRGGALVLKLQAACGFRAFAELRLQAAAIEDAAAGFDHRETGNMLHETMERFWAQVETQDELKRLSDAEKTAKLRAAIDRALSRVVPEGAWDAAYIDVQKQRLRVLVMQWLAKELDRGSFRVLQQEEARQVTVGPLTLRLRFDRIDEVEGGTLLVDYKTGQSLSHKDWTTERPEEPQLPLYSLLPEAEHLKGVAFARIRAGKEMGWVGIAEDGLLPGKPRLEYARMQEQVEAWRWVLERLAQQFVDGETGVDPKIFDQTCRHCEHRILCRVDGLALMESEEGAEAGDGE